MSRPPVAVLIIFDGWGLRGEREGNAIAMARTPTMDRLYATQAHTAIDASGEAVGLMPGIMGNSEVGHLTIGAGATRQGGDRAAHRQGREKVFCFHDT